MPKPDRLVITGASSGLGRELLLCAANSGTSTFALQRTAPDLAQVRWIQQDFRDNELNLCAIDELVLWLRDAVACSIVINAAVMGPTGLDGLRRDEFCETVWVNSVSQIRLVDLVATRLPDLHIDLWVISSGMASINLAQGREYYAYACSKAALNISAKMLEVQRKNVRSASINPGWMRTKMGGHNAPLSAEQSAAPLFELICRGTAALTTRSSGIVDLHETGILPW